MVTLTGLASGKEDCLCSAALVSRTINSSPLLPAGFFFFFPPETFEFLEAFVLFLSFKKISLNVRVGGGSLRALGLAQSP